MLPRDVKTIKKSRTGMRDSLTINIIYTFILSPKGDVDND